MTRRGFTLVEVMISVALVLFLIIGINRVFKITTDTVGAGQVMSQNIRDSRAAQAVFTSDISAAAQNPPMFIIASSRVSAFRNLDDMSTDRDYDPATTPAVCDAKIRTRDLDDNNTEGETTVNGEITSPATYNERNHRTDRLAFFARDLYRRQTANDDQFTNNTSSSEAWIWYGHLRLANNNTTPAYFFPGQPDVSATVKNQNNFVASNFALGRMAMLLRDPNTLAPTEERVMREPPIPAPGAPVPANPKLTPLSAESSTSGTPRFIFNSRYDLADSTIAQFATDLAAVAPGQAHWWQRFVYSITTLQGNQTTPPAISSTALLDYRFRANRFFAKPLDSEKASLLAPILLDGCSQFIVEFAGDYIRQNADGTFAAPFPDGVTDFVVVGGAANIRSVRWYGMPRDTGGPAGAPDGQVISAIDSPDVVPVRDIRGAVSTFERNVAVEMPALADYTSPTAGMAPESRYTCVWGPDCLPSEPLPKMLRLTVQIDDKAGRLAEGQTYEYVVALPY